MTYYWFMYLYMDRSRDPENVTVTKINYTSEIGKRRFLAKAAFFATN